MAQHHHYSITEVENMIPWERDIYVGLLEKHLKEEMERHQEEMNKMKKGRN